MSGRGDDKSIEPAHQPSACQIPWPTVPTVPWTQGAMSEGRVRRVAAEIMVAAEKRLGDAVAKIECRLERVEADVQRLALRVSDAEDQWRRTRARHEAMFRRVEALETTAREIALAGSIGDKDFARRTSDDILAKMDASNSDAAAVLMTPASETGWAIMDKDGLLQAKAPPRETGWAVVLDGQLPTVLIASRTRVAFTPLCAALTVDIHWLGSRADAETLARLLGVGRAAELYKDTLEEVEA